MNKAIRDLSAIFVAIFSFVFCGAIDQNRFVELCQENIKGIMDADFYTSTKLSFALPNNRRIEIELGDQEKGSGNIFREFPTIKARILEPSCGVSNEVKNKEFSLMDLAIILGKNELRKILENDLDCLKDLPFISWISDLKVTPIKFFALKLFLLMKHDFGGNNFRKKIEIVRLLFRLSQSEQFNLVDQDRPLSSYLPDDVKRYVRELMPVSKDGFNWLKFIDEMWLGLGSGFKDYEFAQDGAFNRSKIGIDICGFIFSNAELAQKCCNMLKNNPNCKKANLDELVKDAVDNFGGQVISYKKFMRLKKSREKYNFAAFKDFGKIKDDQDSLPKELKDKLLSSSTFPRVAMHSVSDDEIWVVFACDGLNMVDTSKLLFVTMLKAFKEYAQIRAQEPAVSLEDAFSQEELEAKAEKVEEDANNLEQFNIEKKELEYRKALIIFKLKNLEKDIEKRRVKASKSLIEKELLKQKEDEYQHLITEKEGYEKELDTLEKEIRNLQDSSFFPIKLIGEEKTGLFGVVNTFFNALIQSPELKEMFAILNSDNEMYKAIKDTLLQRVAVILKTSEHVRDNLEVYEYIFETLLPDLKESFDFVVKDIKNSTQGIMPLMLGL